VLRRSQRPCAKPGEAPQPALIVTAGSPQGDRQDATNPRYMAARHRTVAKIGKGVSAVGIGIVRIKE
jgi:hypothetical protein